ncbi:MULTISPECIES: competence protein ComK [unclassified Virgibacillus]|uniref:competence protein ComK n=1 Tax=unclassified Virgibacillus TaxID=2620237 RepID=UPI0024DF066C|nr:competence protein ComK [Virgibacillus sp. LDC-1]
MLDDLYTSSHEVTPVTLAIIAGEEANENARAIILEEKKEYPVSIPPSRIIDQACKFYGSSLRGRQEGTKEICGITHKAPISIDPTSGMYFFPTNSPTNPKCSWIAHSHIDQVNRSKNQCTEIVFKNGRSIVLDVSFGSMLNQVQRTAQFRYLLDNRIKYLQKHMIDLVAEPYA